MASRLADTPLIRSLEETIRELVEPLESVQLQIRDDGAGELPNGLELLMGELTMVVLVLTNADLAVTDEETDILNNFHRAVYGSESFALTSDNYRELCLQFLRIYPDRFLTLDHPPYSVQHLQVYDAENGTEHAEKARAMFLRLANAIVTADGAETSEEMVTLQNFKQILYSNSE